MEAQDLIRGDRVFIDGRWRTVRRAETLSDGLVAVQTRWMSPRWSYTYAPHDDLPTVPRRKRRGGAGLVALLLLLAGCGQPIATDAKPVVPPVATSAKPGLAVPSVATSAKPGLAVPSVTTSAKPGLAVPSVTTSAKPGLAVPSVTTSHAGTCHEQGGRADQKCTPGATNPDVTQTTISHTICVSGWTKTVRPPASYTNRLKVQQITEYGYADTKPADYEEDHLIPLELGGAPSDPHNLWPQPHYGSPRAEDKDQVENQLKAAVCGGSMTLDAAQSQIRRDWTR